MHFTRMCCYIKAYNFSKNAKHWTMLIYLIGLQRERFYVKEFFLLKGWENTITNIDYQLHL